jgi:hypothetical protein
MSGGKGGIGWRWGAIVFGMSSASIRVHMWINAIVLVAFGIGIHAAADTPVSAGAAAALIVIAALLAARTIAGSAILHVGARPVGAPSYARTGPTGVGRQCDPDAPGRARPRAPGIFPLR